MLEDLRKCSFVIVSKVCDAKCKDGGKHKHGSVHQGLGHEVWEHAVHFIGLLSQEHWSLRLEDKDGVEHVAHEKVDGSEKESSEKFHARVKKLLLLSLLRQTFIDLAIKATLVVETDIIENGCHDQREDDLLTDLGLALHGVSHNTEFVSAKDILELLECSSLSLFKSIHVWKWKF